MKIGSLTKPFTPWQLHKLQKEHGRQYYTDDAGYLTERVKIPPQKFMVAPTIVVQQASHRTQKRRGAEGKKQAESGNSPADPEPPRPCKLADEAALADQLCVSKKTIQNIYSRTPHLLPQAVEIPGARGPRWTQQAIQEWLNSRPKHTHKPVPSAAPKRKAGRPRIASGKGVQS